MVHGKEKVNTQQIKSVLEDIGADVVKTGMLSSKQIIQLVAEAVEEHNLKLVLDPVMVAKSGAKLLQDDAIETLKSQLIPKAFLVTPNIPEAEVICGMKINTEADMLQAAKNIIFNYKCAAVLIKGGHMPGKLFTDILVQQNGAVTKVRCKKIETKNTHGTGCTYASAIATYLALGLPLDKAVKKAHKYVQGAIKNAPYIGKGKGPLCHNWGG